MAMDDMGDGLKSGLGGMKKVTVAAPDSQHLKEGLNKAEDMVGEMPMDKDDAESAHEGYDQETEAKLQDLVDNCHSADDLDKKIEFLQKAKEEKFGGGEEQEEGSGSNPFEGME